MKFLNFFSATTTWCLLSNVRPVASRDTICIVLMPMNPTVQLQCKTVYCSSSSSALKTEFQLFFKPVVSVWNEPNWSHQEDPPTQQHAFDHSVIVRPKTSKPLQLTPVSNDCSQCCNRSCEHAANYPHKTAISTCVQIRLRTAELLTAVLIKILTTALCTPISSPHCKSLHKPPVLLHVIISLPKPHANLTQTTPLSPNLSRSPLPNWHPRAAPSIFSTTFSLRQLHIPLTST